ncbi:DUF4097 family beta strand repeat-containing protein [Mucilaginibacter ginkgonis]|uniref:DUF4097 family beta strand repeat protein n=1 Tax=Mucilaginibacter ginkgonis TaxID=2682091 RepID=A0A6I4HWV3_9SPHI|nr:DUF4097 family beta strand repeat-containing protein [Mucilaginibacter ginkgonis]QQL51322.1 DUF4097 family beta strand repeat protein [Mucilaginibacter ginkgonis]
MKTSLLLLLLCAGSSAFAQRANQEPYMTKTLPGNIKEAFVNTSGGSITVRGTTAGDTRVDVFVNGNNGQPLDNAEAKSRLEKDYTLIVDVQDGEVHATAKSKNNRGWNWNNNNISVSFRLYVPVRTATNLETSGGSITMDNLTGTQQFGTSGGSLHLDHLTGNIKGETSGGSITVANSKENINLQTSGGSIHADNCNGIIRLETSGGSLTLNHLSGNIKAGTSGGSIHGDGINGELITSTSGGSITLDNLSASLDASTSAGSLHANFKQVGKYVKLDVSAGHIDLTLPAKQGLDLDLSGNRVTGESLPGFSGEHDRDRIRGKVNGGGATVKADAGSGHVNVSFTN